MKKIITLALATLISTTATAANNGFNEKNLYFGGGLGSNSASGVDSATGFQIFAGYELDMVKISKIDSSVEIGYMDSGDMKKEVCTPAIPPFIPAMCDKASAKAKGLWATYVASYKFDDKLSGIGRAGLDFGDDDGFMFGLGVDYQFDKQMHIRGEYVVRQNINSLQANFVYDMK